MSAEAPAWPEGVDRVVLEQIDSTNAEAARRAPGLKRPVWIMAREQTAARGRRGRAWVNPEGNFAATLLMRPDLEAGLAAQLSFVASLSLLRALTPFVRPQDRIALKWPNDVLLNGGKLAGILLESSGGGRRIDWLAIGVGVNLLLAPGADEVEQRALRPVSLSAETGQVVTPEALLDRLAAEFATQYLLWEKEGFASYRALWLRHAARLGETLTARTGTDEVTGTFETVDKTGALILRTEAGPRAIPAAEIYF